jgi:hypothetical protein
VNTELKIPFGDNNKWITKHWNKLIIGTLSIAMFIFMNRYSSAQSFWLDEIYQIGFFESATNIKELLVHYAKKGPNAPLFAVFGFLWYQIAPYGEEWLLLLPQIFICIGVYVLGMAASKKSKYIGIITALIACTSARLILSAGYEMRAYSLLFLNVSIALYLFIKKYYEPTRKKTTIFAYGLSLSLIVYTHYIAILVCISLFIMDIILISNKKESWHDILSYVFGGILAAPWVVMVLIFKEWNVDSYWAEVPDFLSINLLFKFIGGSNDILYLLFYICIFLVILSLLKNIINKKLNYEKNFLQSTWLFNILFTIGVVYIYSSIINPDGSIFVNRYFFCIIPPLFILCATELELLCHKAAKWLNVKALSAHRIIIIMCVVILLSFSYYCYEKVDYQTRQKHDPFREAANWIMSQEDIYNHDIAVTTTAGDIVENNYALLGFDMYYLRMQGNRNAANTINVFKYKETPDELLAFNRIYCAEIHSTDETILAFDNIIPNNFIKSSPDSNGVVIYTKK